MEGAIGAAAHDRARAEEALGAAGDGGKGEGVVHGEA
jgi:hypothetical protein